MEDLIVVATLHTGKKIVVGKPDLKRAKISYSYLTDQEMLNDAPRPFGRRIWIDTELYKKVENDTVIVFFVVDATPVVLTQFM